MKAKGKPKSKSANQAGASRKWRLDARMLRGLGEKADATRDKELALVRMKKAVGGRRYDIIEVGDAVRGQVRKELNIIDYIYTGSTLPGRKWMEVTLKVNGRKIPLDDQPYDGAFWSESACEKFLWPYYEGMRIWDKKYLTRLKKAFKDRDVVGILHVGESDALTVTKDGPARIVISNRHQIVPVNILTLSQFESFKMKRGT